MPKKTRVSTLMDSQPVKRSKTPLKAARQKCCHIFWSFRNKIRLKNSVLAVSKILRLFVNIWTLEDKYYLSVKASV